MMFTLELMDQSDWPNHRVGMYAPGPYVQHCHTCGKEFMGDKRAMYCYPCAKQIVDIQVENNKGVGI